MSILKKYLALAALFCVMGYASLLAQAPGWTVNPGDYSNNMTIVARLEVDDLPEDGMSNVLGAFVGNELRGVATPIELFGSATFFMTVYSNQNSGETITFKAYLSDEDDVFDVLETIPFVKNDFLGFPEAVVLSISSGGDFPIALSPIPADTTLAGIAFPPISLDNYLLSQDNDPVNWTVGSSTNLQGTIDANNNLSVTPVNPNWTGTDSLLVTATETGTANAYSANKWVRFTILPDYGDPVFGTMPSWFVQEGVPLPAGDLDDFLSFGGPCLEYSLKLMLPEGQYAAPDWEQPGTNSGSMSLVVRPEYSGTNIIGGSGDRLAAYVGGQLAGVTRPSIHDGVTLYFLTLANVGSGNITFMLYDADHNLLHSRATNQPFDPTNSAGTVFDPLVVDFSPIQVSVNQDGTWSTTVLDPYWSGEQFGMFYAKDCEYGQKIDSVQALFIITQCEPEYFNLPATNGLCLQADFSYTDVIWYQDGMQVGTGYYHGALTAGVYHYEGLTSLGCPDVKSCPVIIETGVPFKPGKKVATAAMPDNPIEECGTVVHASITVDETPPVAVCQSTTVYLDANGEGSISVEDVDGGSYTNCGTGTLSISETAFDCADVNANIVVLTIEDSALRTDTCHATVTVVDNIKPVAVCKNATVELDANGEGSITTADVFDDVNSSDNCGDPYPVFVTPNTFDCDDIGANTVTLQIIDLNGNTQICAATVTVEDKIGPDVTCKNTNVTLNSQGQASIQPIQVYASASDNCSGNVTLVSVSPSSFSCANVGATSVTLTVKDSEGNTSTCTATVNVNDNVDPTAVCKDVTVALDANGEASISVSDVDDGSSDNCNINSMSLDVTDFDCDDVGANTVTLTVSDDNGNTDSCTATATVEDNTAPDAQCQDFTTDLDPDGNYTLLPSDIDNGSSDACGLSLSVSPSQFSCANSGANTVTLTATDDNGNTATCTATVTINGGVSITSVNITHESCAGYGDGVIVIVASAGPGVQLRYSINGGATWQFTNVFTDLSPATYDIVVEISGNGSCSVSTTAVVNAGSSQSTWYKDLDGDGYTDGITQVSCSPPAGYVASALPGDCNDNDASINPGAPELCNGLDDNCDGVIPADEQDADGDGYRLCDGDCDDTDPDINPGAAEVCNGIDDDCDGQIDEGAPPNVVHVGNVTFANQNAVNNFSPCVYKIQGNLTIVSPNINSLANLSNLQEVTGNVLIQVTGLSNMNGLDGLTTIGGSLTIKLNNYGAKLTSLSGLQNLTSIGQNLNISFNFSLSDCCSIDDLLSNAGVGGNTTIFNNSSGCNSVSDIGNSCGGGNIIINPGSGIAFGEQSEEPRLSLFPNPATSTVTILLEGLADQPGILTITDQLGRAILMQKLDSGTEVIDLDLRANDMNNGVYQVAVTTESQLMIQRLLVRK
ncbi:MAG: hypothetical protein CMN32_16105 [Saprospirales bacterium]|nr:hypothetical protein [Saprospirales bacterium]